MAERLRYVLMVRRFGGYQGRRMLDRAGGFALAEIYDGGVARRRRGSVLSGSNLVSTPRGRMV